jgi:hypothetical protein
VISLGKRQVLDGMGEIFERPNKKRVAEREAEAECDRLLKIVGELNGEGDFLKKCRECGGDPK